jgi:CspA family cold shock protein
MARFGFLLAIVGTALFIGARPAAAQMMGGKGWHDSMCKRMCDQYGKKNQVCGRDGKTYDNACVAKCDKVTYKRGACPKEEEKDEGVAVIPLTEDETAAAIEAEDKRPGGVVKFFDWDKGQGAITADDGKELYVDASEVTGDAVETLKEGDRVKFDVTEGPKGIHAAKVALELTDEQKQAKLDQAAELQVVEEQKPQQIAAPKQLLRETKSDDGVYILPSR